jgi:hypothetical protein
VLYSDAEDLIRLLEDLKLLDRWEVGEGRDEG